MASDGFVRFTAAGLRRTGWSGKTPASPDFRFTRSHGNAVGNLNRMERHTPAHGAVASKVSTRGHRDDEFYLSLIPPTRKLWIAAHRQVPASDRRKLGFFAVISRMRWRTSRSLAFADGLSSLVRKNAPVNGFFSQVVERSSRMRK